MQKLLVGAGRSRLPSTVAYRTYAVRHLPGYSPDRRPPKVWVLWDNGTNRPRSKTHALDCHMIGGFHWVKGDYRKVDAKDIPDDVGRCGFCGGGRPAPTNARNEPVTHAGATPVDAVAAEPPERVGALGLGLTARVLDEMSGELLTWTIVRPGEADVASGRLSTESPIAKALTGQVAGERVTVETPRGPRRYTVLELVS